MGYYDSPSVIPATALRNVYKNATSGKHNVELAELLIQLVGVYPVSSAVQLNTLEKGVVTKVNWRDALKPLVTILYDSSGHALMRTKTIDLYKQNESQTQRSITKVLNPADRQHDSAGILVYAV